MRIFIKSQINQIISEIRDHINSGLNKKWHLDGLGVNRVFWGERGTGDILLIKRLNKFCKIRDSLILIQGIGRGKEILNFLYNKPKMIVGCDLQDRRAAWISLMKNLNKYNIPIHIIQNDMHTLCFANESFDSVVSFAVYEHVTNLNEATKESQRILKRDGVIFASLGPLYYCFGGDHFSGHGGIAYGYNHLFLSKKEYIDYFDLYSYQLGTEKEDYRRDIIERPLFSYLKFNDYINIFNKYFKIEYLAIKISHEALLFQRDFPDKFDWLQKNFGITAYDLIIKSIIAYMRKYR
jgi:SAM-dependent methyltransferase